MTTLCPAAQDQILGRVSACKPYRQCTGKSHWLHVRGVCRNHPVPTAGLRAGPRHSTHPAEGPGTRPRLDSAQNPPSAPVSHGERPRLFQRSCMTSPHLLPLTRPHKHPLGSLPYLPQILLKCPIGALLTPLIKQQPGPPQGPGLPGFAPQHFSPPDRFCIDLGPNSPSPQLQRILPEGGGVIAGLL